MKTFIPCVVCGHKALWSYMPGKNNYCDNHVPRGCTCNQRLKEGIDWQSEAAKDPANYVENLDAQGRKIPCCEYSDIPDDFHNDKELVESGWDAYYEDHPEERQESDEIERWEHKLGIDKE